MLELPESPITRTVRTAANRVVGYYEYGDPAGVPIVALHGTPACGAGFAWADRRARERGIRLLAPDRPGVGDSDPWPRGHGPTVVDYPPELFAFADAVGLDSFSILGYSGGGPYALAAAHQRADRVAAVAIVSGSGQVGVWASVTDFETVDRLLTRAAQRVPALARVSLTIGAQFSRVIPRTSLWFGQLEMSTPDRMVMAEFPSARAALAVFTQSCRARFERSRRRLRRARPAVGFPGRGDRRPRVLLARDHRRDRPRAPHRRARPAHTRRDGPAVAGRRTSRHRRPRRRSARRARRAAQPRRQRTDRARVSARPRYRAKCLLSVSR